jgi:hypothetical protein
MVCLAVVTSIPCAQAQAYPQLPGSGRSILFEGADQRIETGPIVLGSQVSFEAWVQLLSPRPAYQYIFSSCDDPNSACTGQDYGTFGVGINSSGLIDAQYAPTNWGLRRVYLQTTVGAQFLTGGRWTHIAVVLDLNTNTGAIYVDGIAKPVSNMSLGSGPGTLTAQPAIGALKVVQPGGPSVQYPMRGYVDEIRVWNGLLTQSSVRDHMCRKDLSSHPLSGQLLALYRCDDIDPRVDVKDLVGGHDGIYLGATTTFAISEDSHAPIGDRSAHSYGAASVSLAVQETMTVTYAAAITGIQLYRIDQPSPDPAPGGLVHANTGHWGFHAIDVASASYTIVYDYGANTVINGSSTEPSLQLAQRNRPGPGGLGTWGFNTGGQSVNTTANSITIAYGSSTFRRMWSPVLLAPACAEVIVELTTDDAPDETSWEIAPLSGGAALCTGVGFPPNSVITSTCCLPDGCYTLRVLDLAGDGITMGGYILRTQGTNQRIIDDRNNFSTGSVSAISGGQGFCLPISNDKLIFTSCDKLDWVSNQYLVATPNAAVSAQWLVGDQTDDGYEFWIFDPNGSYSFRRFRNHATSDLFGPASATRACHMRLNNWTVANQVPANVPMNVRVRARVNGVNGEFGPACRMAIHPALAACPQTQLMNIPGDPNFSCGATRMWGNGNYVHARPVSGANRYQFRFRIAAEGYSVTRTTTTYFVQLNWALSAGAPLVDGKTYDVDVRVSKDAGATWCSVSDPWGPVCLLTIDNTPANSGNQNFADEDGAAELSMFPNPNRGDVLNLSLSAIVEGVNTVSVEIYDLTGKRMSARTIAVTDGNVNTILDINGELAAGMYVVNITAGETVYSKRLVIQP